jgi:hypothetical protein
MVYSACKTVVKTALLAIIAPNNFIRPVAEKRRV